MWRHLAHCAPGSRRVADGSACQDCCAVRALGNAGDSALVACIADGAGSSKHGGVGATLACESIVQSVCDYHAAGRAPAGITSDEVILWCETARAAIADYAETRDHRLRDYATTLSAAVVSPRRSVLFQVGDGAIVLRRRSAYGVVFWPQSGQYINETNFLTSPEFRDQIQILAVENGFADIALFTDGLERLALRFDDLTPHTPFFQPLFETLRSTSDVAALERDFGMFLQSEAVRNKTDDDATLVLASCVDDATCAA